MAADPRDGFSCERSLNNDQSRPIHPLNQRSRTVNHQSQWIYYTKKA
ncbi:MAG: hypothetical protein ACFB14_28420 [Leptolyngbyaceae cyanobacterium]